MKEKNIFGLVEYNRQDFFDEPTDEIRFADRFYIMTEADAVLKGQQELIAEKDNEIAELKKKLESVQASMYADVVDANMDNRRLKRALYKALANWSHIAVAFFSSYATKDKWRKMERKCIKKAEEYK